MRRNSGKSAIVFSAVIVLAAVVTLVPGGAVVKQEPPPAWDAATIPVQVEKGLPKLDHALYMFQKIHETQGPDKAREYAERRRLDVEGDAVRVIVETSGTMITSERINGRAAVLESHVRSLGGRVEDSCQELFQCRIPAAGLWELAGNPVVRFVRPPLRPHTQAETSEGVSLTGANLWHDLDPYRASSAGVKVCVLDLGFKNHNLLLGTELPATVRTRSFRADGDIAAGEVHGTACAEIVHDMMPDAQLYLVNFNTELEHRQAVEWLIGEKVDVISYSIAWFNAGDGKGTGPICQTVKRAADNGILWVGAAGNYAEDHWEGTFGDSDTDGWHNFSGGDEILHFYVPAYQPVAAFLNWDDWGVWNGIYYSGSIQDYDLYLYIWSGGNFIFVDKSENWQSGDEWPVEFIGYWYANAATYWGVAVRKYSATRNCKLELFTYGNSEAVEYNVPEGSLAIPADSEDCIAVGATDTVTLPDYYHPYSSRGPTHDGRVKPDFTAPSGVSVSNLTYGYRGFYGTSASAPHMAGGLALVKGKTPYGWDEVRAILESRAVDLGPSGKDNQFGFGRLNVKK